MKKKNYIYKVWGTALGVLFSIAVSAQVPFTKVETKNMMRKVADWQIANPGAGNEHDDVSWTNAALYMGMIDWAELSEREDQYDFYYQWLMRMGNRNQYQLGKWMYHADFIAVAQVYIDLYKKYGKERILWPTLARTDWVIAHPSSSTLELDYGRAETLDRWSWCDALFMAPPVYAKLYALTGDKRYIDFMNREYKATYDFLFDKDEKLFYRDCRYFGKKEANGQKVFWGRGNGWVLGGLCEILQALPAKDKNRSFYEELFVTLSTRIAELQSADGYWHASLLDPASYPSPETSATGFIVYALAYGINEGLLEKEAFLPVVVKGWQAMLDAVEPNGKLGYVQPIGADPRKVTRSMTEVYGVGAFLLAGNQVYKLAR
ncbi:glycoside hydrolase family 88/105 protein [Phocaeicola sp.]